MISKAAGLASGTPSATGLKEPWPVGLATVVQGEGVVIHDGPGSPGAGFAGAGIASSLALEARHHDAASGWIAAQRGLSAAADAGHQSVLLELLDEPLLLEQLLP